MYKLSNPVIPSGQSQFVGRLSDNTWISILPENENNPDYQAYLKFLEEGGVPLPADEPNA